MSAITAIEVTHKGTPRRVVEVCPCELTLAHLDILLEIREQTVMLTEDDWFGLTKIVGLVTGKQTLAKLAQYAQDKRQECENLRGIIREGQVALEPYIAFNTTADLPAADFAHMKRDEARAAGVKLQQAQQATVQSLGFVGALFEQAALNMPRQKGKRNG